MLHEALSATFQAPQFDREDLTEVTDEEKWLVVKVGKKLTLTLPNTNP